MIKKIKIQQLRVGMYIYDLYLSEGGGENGGEKIVSCESPDRWNLQAEAYL